MVDGQQHLVIKTWEKVRHEESYIIFNIKTIRVFDSLIQNSKAILTEQVDGNFARHHFYDTSTLKYGSKIYYFKRIQNYEHARDHPKSTCEIMPTKSAIVDKSLLTVNQNSLTTSELDERHIEIQTMTEE